MTRLHVVGIVLISLIVGGVLLAMMNDRADLATLSLAALMIVVVASCCTPLHPGILAIVLAWVLALYLAPYFGLPPEARFREITAKDLLAGFPVDLFLTLVGVTLLFTQAHVNGTLDRVTQIAVRLCRGNVGLIPIMFFLLAAGLATIGAGNIAASALISPMAMATAHRARIPPFLMAIMVCHGAIAGGLSPVSPTGIIANKFLRERLNIDGIEWSIYLHNLGFNLVIGILGYLVFGGWKLFGRTFAVSTSSQAEDAGAPAAAQEPDAQKLERTHVITLGVLILFVGGVLYLGASPLINVGMVAFAAACVLTALGQVDEAQALRKMPWSVIVMVCGVTVLTSLLEHTGGAKRLIEIIATVSSPQTVAAMAAFFSGVISVYSSTSGVVLPAFLPLVPGLVSSVGGSSLGIASSIIVGGHLVDSSPLSTIGALCIACAGPGEDRALLFRQMLIWGLAMSVVGAVGCYLVF